MSKKITAKVKEAVANKPTDPAAYKASVNAARRKAKNEFLWTPEKEKAARLLSEHRISYARVAEQTGTTYAGLHNWMENPEFIARVIQYEESWKKRVKEHGLALREVRVSKYNDLSEALDMVREGRIKYYKKKGKSILGVDTGLVIERVKFKTKRNGSQVTVREYELDTGMISAELALGTAVSKELGQHVDHSEVKNVTIIREYGTDTSQV